MHLSEVARAGGCDGVVSGDLAYGLWAVKEQSLAIVGCFLYLLQPAVVLSLALSTPMCGEEGEEGQKSESEHH